MSRKIEKLRKATLGQIHEQQQEIEEMAQRAAACGEQVDETLLAKVRSKLAEISQRAMSPAITVMELEELDQDAAYQGQFSAYLCPQREIANEGSLCLDEFEEWNVPKVVIARLRTLLGTKILEAEKDPAGARSALRALFEEYDSWDDYTSDYERTMERIALALLVGIVMTLPAAILLATRSLFFPASILLAGLAGSFMSILSRMPAIEVGYAGELISYLRRVVVRIAVGIGAALIGSALLAWGVLPVAIHGISYTDVVFACTRSPASCNGVQLLVFLGIPVMFGFSERALASFESKIWGR